MASAIDPTRPADGVPPVKLDLRANLQAAKDEIEALQAGKAEVGHQHVLGDITDAGALAAKNTVASGDVDDDAVIDAKIRNSGALSVIGRSVNSSGDPADISATPGAGGVLRESSNSLGFGAITLAAVSDAGTAAAADLGNGTGQLIAVAAGQTPTGAKFLRDDGALVTPDGSGDMLAATYDPTSVAGDAFDMANMVEAANAKVLTAAERTLIAGALQPTIQQIDIDEDSVGSGTHLIVDAERAVYSPDMRVNVALDIEVPSAAPTGTWYGPYSIGDVDVVISTENDDGDVIYGAGTVKQTDPLVHNQVIYLRVASNAGSAPQVVVLGVIIGQSSAFYDQ